MGKQTEHTHPNRFIYLAQQISLTILFALTVFAALMLIAVAVLLSAPLFILMSGIVLFLSLFVVMGMVNTPPIIITDEGIILKRFIGGDRLILWQEIKEVAPYPLLPQANQEILKQYLIGRNKYRAAEGLMLIVPSLPFVYRIASVLAGEKGAPIVAFTNRAHRDYDILNQRILHHANHAIREILLQED